MRAIGEYVYWHWWVHWRYQLEWWWWHLLDFTDDGAWAGGWRRFERWLRAGFYITHWSDWALFVVMRLLLWAGVGLVVVTLMLLFHPLSVIGVT